MMADENGVVTGGDNMLEGGVKKVQGTYLPIPSASMGKDQIPQQHATKHRQLHGN